MKDLEQYLIGILMGICLICFAVLCKQSKRIQTLKDQGIECVSDLVTCEGKNDK